jgi:hypothetical protein
MVRIKRGQKKTRRNRGGTPTGFLANLPNGLQAHLKLKHQLMITVQANS